MEKKTIEKQTVLMYSLTTTLATMIEDYGKIPYEIEAKVKELGIKTIGPHTWQYNDLDGRPNTKFKLDICLPVNEAKGEPGKFRFDVLPEITCVSEIHNGSWSKLGDTYCRVFGEINRKGIIPAGSSREVYHQFGLEDDSKNITEIQIIINQ